MFAATVRTAIVALLAAFLAGEGRAGSGAPQSDEAELSPVELLGKRVFEDPTLSRPAGVSCASCHDPATAFQGNNGSPVAGVARGAPPGALGKRNTPSIMYASFAPSFAFVDDRDALTGKVEKIPVGGQFLDGRADTLVAQFEGPLFDPGEMNALSRRATVETIRDGDYAGLVRRLYGERAFDDPDAIFQKLATAVAAYESTARFHPFASKFDDYLRGKTSLSALEQKGFDLFRDPQKGNCLACHAGRPESRDPRDWLFTDFTYDALGAPKNAAIPATRDAPDLGLCGRPGLSALAPAGFEVASLCGAFKVPGLRNVAVTAPYLHNGVFGKLRDVVAFYATRDTEPAKWYPKKGGKFDDLPARYRANVNVSEVPYDRKRGQKPRLTPAEIDAITAFLETLTDRPTP